MARALCLYSFAVALLAVGAAPARADVPAPDGTYRPKPWGYGAPPPGWFERNGSPNPAPDPAPPPPLDPVTGLPRVPRDPPQPKRTGPFRSCGSGAGTGLAGVGATWAVLWLGSRLAGRVARRAKTDPTE